MFYSAFPSALRENLNKVIVIMPNNTFNNVSAITSDNTIAYIIDDYIVEILEIIYDKLKERDNTDIQSFCLRNKVSTSKSYSRMISYWNEYYRSYEFDFRKYLGRSLFRECFLFEPLRVH